MKTVEDALEALQQVVAEFGDGYVYPDEHLDRETGDSCVYATPDGTPQCIVGHVLDRWNLLYLLKRSVVEGGYHNPSIDGALAYKIPLSTVAASVLRVAQETQDRGETWGSALIAAKEKAETLRTVGVE